MLELFAGYGGLGLGVTAATGAEPVVYVERGAFAAAVLVARMAEAALARAPVWDDVGTFDGRPWRDQVDCVVGGSPCQDLSLAGKRAGLAGARSGLWREMLRIVDETGPAFVWWENVGGAISSALGVVTEDLEGLGFRVAACTLLASDVGATHERNRLFVLAYSDSAARRLESRRRGWASRSRAAFAGHAGEDVADTHGHGLTGERSSGLLDCFGQALGNDVDGRGGAELGDSNAGDRHGRKRKPQRRQVERATSAGSGAGVDNRSGKENLADPDPDRARREGRERAEPSPEGARTPRPASERGGDVAVTNGAGRERNGTGRPVETIGGGALSEIEGPGKRLEHAACDGRSEGRPESEVGRKARTDLAGHRFPPGPTDAEGWRTWSGAQPSFRRGADGPPAGMEFTNDRLELLGNGVVPQQSAVAFLVCWQRLFGGGQ